MTERMKRLYTAVLAKEHHQQRRELPAGLDLASKYAERRLPDLQRVTDRLQTVLAAETPRVGPDEKIAFVRTVAKLPPIFTDEEFTAIKGGYYIHELGFISNICPDYGMILSQGLQARKDLCLARLAVLADRAGVRGDDPEIDFLNCTIQSIDAVLDLAERYSAAARAAGNDALADILQRVPRLGASSFHEALQMLRILHFTLWCEGEYHNVLGRLDQYLYPWLQQDLASGRLNEMAALELLEEFFLACNKDTDLYPGVQQGDNGQSLMLGGVGAEGRDAFNRLSELCLEASGELKMIDPKINLRVGKDTPMRIYELGTRLTRDGLGFPQYSNDDVVIPGLTRLGYSLADARNYTVAACWEFIIPGYGADVPNIGALNLPQIVNRCVDQNLAGCGDFPAFLEQVKIAIGQEARTIAERVSNLYFIPAPFLSSLLPDCLEKARDISLGSRYNNFGLHGVGIATAVDALAAIQKQVYERRAVTSAQLKQAMAADFRGYGDLLELLRQDSPKFGQDEPAADAIATELLAGFATALRPLRNERGGCYRAGTGSAMYYLWHAAETGSTAGGHLRGEPYAANYSPDLAVKSRGPLSVLRSLSRPNLQEVVNGGPLTLEFHSSVFRDDDSIAKVAGLVRTYIALGGHQLQLNAVNRETLLDAQRYPDRYPNLIVRVWGWSAYFVELDRAYQDHVISRLEYAL
ncbi:MAG TPA: pyruvate formate-lyase [Clostridiales bacterium]|nr:pyruvate formate-lyase [Clostridiales bacterium]